MAVASTTTSAAPFAKLVDIGDSIVGALASDPGKSKRQKRNYETQQPETKPDGRPMLEEVLHLVAMPGCSAKTGTAESGYNPIQPGDHIRYALSGHKWGLMIDARKTLPAHGQLRSGQPGGGDVVTITHIGWSTATDNPAAAVQAGFTVVDGRIVMRSTEERERYVLAKMRQGGGNVNTATDLEITTRRPTPAEKVYEDQADALWLTEPWKASEADVAKLGAGPFDEAPADPGPGF